jgi:site-specific DNA recombinase
LELSELLTSENKCAFYGRHSTDKQDMTMQIDLANEFSKKYGIEIVKKYLDPAVSATRKPLEKREKINELFSDLEKDLFDFVIVFKVDRIARDIEEINEVRTLFSAANKPILILESDPPVLDDEPGDVFGFLKSALPQFEISQTRERTRAKALMGAKAGKNQGGKPIFGYDYDKKIKKYIQIPEEILLVQQVFELYLQGNGCRKIAKKMPPNSYNGKSWTRNRVENIIKNPKYAGFHRWGVRHNHIDNKGKEVIEVEMNGIEPVISKELWDRCYNLFIARGKKRFDPQYTNTSYLIRDFAICKHCNEKLKPVNQETKGQTSGNRLYICLNDDCKKLRLLSTPIDRTIQNRIRNELIMNQTIPLMKHIKSSFLSDRKNIEQDLEKANERKKDFVSKIANIDYKIQSLSMHQFNDTNRLLIESFTLYRMNLQNNIDILEQQVSELKEKINNINNVLTKKEHWLPILQTLDKEREEICNSEWRLLIFELVDSIIISKLKGVKHNVELNLKYGISSIKFIYDEKKEANRKQLTFEDIT